MTFKIKHVPYFLFFKLNIVDIYFFSYSTKAGAEFTKW